MKEEIELEKEEYTFEETKNFFDHLETFKNSNKIKLIEKILKFLEEIKENPKKGTGKPEALKHYGERDVWSRRINDEHRLVYEIFTEIKVVKLLSAYGHYNEKKKDKNTLF